MDIKKKYIKKFNSSCYANNKAESAILNICLFVCRWIFTILISPSYEEFIFKLLFSLLAHHNDAEITIKNCNNNNNNHNFTENKLACNMFRRNLLLFFLILKFFSSLNPRFLNSLTRSLAFL
jgi:hypothetical protein